MSEQPGDVEQAARAREERLADIRARTSWDPERDPDPVIPFRTQHPLGAVVDRPSVWSDR